MIKKTKTILEVDEAEINTLIECLRYCLHRIVKHENTGISKVTTQKKIQAILNEIL